MITSRSLENQQGSGFAHPVFQSRLATILAVHENGEGKTLAGEAKEALANGLSVDDSTTQESPDSTSS
jgi:hypothetical protein